MVPANGLEDSVSPSFQSPAFKPCGFKFLDVLIKDLTLLKKCLFIPGIAHTKILTMSVLPSLKSFGLEFWLLFLLSLSPNDGVKWTLFNHSRKLIQRLGFSRSKRWYEANTKSTAVCKLSATLHQSPVPGCSRRISIFQELFTTVLGKYKHLPQYLLQ